MRIIKSVSNIIINIRILKHYTKALEQLNKAENTYGREIGNLNNTINELRNKIQNLEDAEKKS